MGKPSRMAAAGRGKQSVCRVKRRRQVEQAKTEPRTGRKKKNYTRNKLRSMKIEGRKLGRRLTTTWQWPTSKEAVTRQQ